MQSSASVEALRSRLALIQDQRRVECRVFETPGLAESVVAYHRRKWVKLSRDLERILDTSRPMSSTHDGAARKLKPGFRLLWSLRATNPLKVSKWLGSAERT